MIRPHDSAPQDPRELRTYHPSENCAYCMNTVSHSKTEHDEAITAYHAQTEWRRQVLADARRRKTRGQQQRIEMSDPGELSLF